jgi:hypothetical protein
MVVMKRSVLLVFAIDAPQMSHLSRIDTALVRLLGKDFSILGTRVKPITAASMKQVCHGGTQAPAVLKAPLDGELESVLVSNPSFVLSINLLSLLLVRLLSSEAMMDSSQIAVVEFLLRFVEIGRKSGSHKFVNKKCMICTRCTF